jgi:hypothetical protein
LNFVADTWEINIILDQRVIRPKYGKGSPYNQDRYVTDGWVTYICLLNLPMHRALEGLVRPLGLIPVLKKNYVWITSQHMLATDAMRMKVAPKNPSEHLLNVLESPTSLEFDHIPIEVILNFFKDCYCFDIGNILAE